MPARHAGHGGVFPLGTRVPYAKVGTGAQQGAGWDLGGGVAVANGPPGVVSATVADIVRPGLAPLGAKAGAVDQHQIVGVNVVYKSWRLGDYDTAPRAGAIGRFL